MKKLAYVLISGVSAAAALFGFFCYYERNDGLLKVYFLDVGQGDAIYIRSPSGGDMLVDGGPSKAVLRELSKIMPWYDRFIDVVVETHPDADHIGGLPDILKRYSVGLFLEPGVSSKNSLDDEIHSIIEEKGIKSMLARYPMSVDLGAGVFFNVLFPDRDVSEFKDTNDASLVGRVVYGSTSVMLTGDSPKAIENELVKKYGSLLSSDILKAGHHGSRTSSGEEYVKTVNPQYVVFSVGKDNRYGHPHKETVGLFNRLNVIAFRTDESGTLQFISDGRNMWRK